MTGWFIAVLAGCDSSASALPGGDPLSTADPEREPNTASALGAIDANRPPTLTTRIRVRAERVSQRAIASGQTATGVVQAYRKSVVSAEAGGSVTQRRIEPGTQVEAGQVLIELDAQRSQIAYDRAAADAQARAVDYAQAEHELLRGKRLRERNVISQDTLDDLRFNLDRTHSVLAAAKAQRSDAARSLADSKVRAPFSGTAEIVHVQKGDFLAPGTPVATLADFSKVRVIAGVTAETAASLQVGTTTRIGLGAARATEVEGTIKSVGRIADSNGTFPLELWVTGKQVAGLREGMVATVQLPQAVDQQVVSIPRAALLRRDGGMFVYVLDNATARLRPVSLGRSDTDFAQVTQGLTLGERVIVDGLFALRDGAPVELLE